MTEKILNVKVNKLEHDAFKPYGTLICAKDSPPYSSNEEFDFWLGTDDIITAGSTAQINWYVLKTNSEFICNYLEQHKSFTTTLIPVEGQSIILFGLSEKEKDSDIALPDLETVSAFYFDGTKGVNLKPGTWFWNRFSLTDKSTFAVILKHNFAFNAEDTRIINLQEEFETTIKIEL